MQFSQMSQGLARCPVRDAGASRSIACPRGAWERGCGKKILLTPGESTLYLAASRSNIVFTRLMPEDERHGEPARFFHGGGPMKRIQWWPVLGVAGTGVAETLLSQSVWGQPES